MDWVWVLGFVGGAIPDSIRIIQGRYRGALPSYLSTLSFWIGFILLVAAGGFVAWLGKAHSVQEALAYGFAAPEILSRLLSSSGPPTLGPPTSGIRHFWSY